MKTSGNPIVVEENFNSPVETVWKSITDVNKMRQWYFDNIPAFKAEVGFRTEFNVQTQNADFPHVWEVTAVIPLKHIQYRWRYRGYAGDSFVTFELFPQKNVTKLRLTHQVTEDFPEDIPEFTRESGLMGWTYFIKERLKSFLGKND